MQPAVAADRLGGGVKAVTVILTVVVPVILPEVLVALTA